MLIGRQRQLRLAVRRPSPRTLDRNAPAAERHLAVLVAVTDRGPLRVPLALRADDLVDLLLQQLSEHTEPDLDRQRQQSLLRRPHQLPQRLLHALREHGLIADRLRDRYVARHGGSSFGSWPDRPSRSHQERTGRRDRRHLKVLRAPGQPPVALAGKGVARPALASLLRWTKTRRLAPARPGAGQAASFRLGRDVSNRGAYRSPRQSRRLPCFLGVTAQQVVAVVADGSWSDGLVAEDGCAVADPFPERRGPGEPCVIDDRLLVEFAGVEADRADVELALAVGVLLE